MGFVKSAYIKENFGGNKMFKKLKDKKGFTLVELIVVLVILAILAALLVPALTGYIDKANKEKVVSETRMLVMAAQTEASSGYGTLKSDATNKAAAIAKYMQDNGAELLKLAEVKGAFDITVDDSGVVTNVTYSNNGFTCLYNGAYNVGKDGTTGYTKVTGHKVGGTAITETASNAGGNAGQKGN